MREGGRYLRAEYLPREREKAGGKKNNWPVIECSSDAGSRGWG